MKTADRIKLYAQIDDYREDWDEPNHDIEQRLSGWTLLMIWLVMLLPGAVFLGWVIYHLCMWAGS